MPQHRLRLHTSFMHHLDCLFPSMASSTPWLPAFPSIYVLVTFRCKKFLARSVYMLTIRHCLCNSFFSYYFRTFSSQWVSRLHADKSRCFKIYRYIGWVELKLVFKISSLQLPTTHFPVSFRCSDAAYFTFDSNLCNTIRYKKVIQDNAIICVIRCSNDTHY